MLIKIKKSFNISILGVFVDIEERIKASVKTKNLSIYLAELIINTR